MATHVQTLPASSSSTRIGKRPSWAAIAMLAVVVIALGASLIHVLIRPVDGHAVFAPDDWASLMDDAPPSSVGASMPVNTVAPGESLVQPKPAARKEPAPAAASAAARTAPPATTTPALPTRAGSTPAQAAPVSAPAPVAQAMPGPYVVTTSGPLAAQPVAGAWCTHCGRIESVTPMQPLGQPHGIGAMAGGAPDDLAGTRTGAGSGPAVVTILGAAGGGMAGHTIVNHPAAILVYRVRIRMDDGSVREFDQAHAPAIGTPVMLDTAPQPGTDGGYRISTDPTAPAPRGAKVYSTERN